MATSTRESFDVNVKDFRGGSVLVKVYPDWDVARVKSEIARRTHVDPKDFRIVFAGQSLLDTQRLWDIGVQGYSTLHCIRFRGVEVKMDKPLVQAANDLGAMTLNSMSSPPASSSQGQARHRFYVYCKNPCNKMAPGKLRVRCADCKDTSFVLSGGPGGWDDVLTPRKLQGQCHKESCGGRYAEFFFKCANHPTTEKDECVALHMVRANTIKVECATCMDVCDLVVVFNCSEGHCLCVECFETYCKEQLTNRRFIEKPDIGYTLKCPAGCEGSEVTEIHHFRILGKELYNRYQRFGTEEFILQMGGVLCPNAGCGQGLLPEDPGRRVQCPRMTGGCGYVFCRECKQEYHEGPCTQASQAAQQGQQFQVNPENLQRARWVEANERFIESNTKPCPRCKAPIEKNGGCMHMTCAIQRCRFEFCWICETEWNRNCQGTHWFG